MNKLTMSELNKKYENCPTAVKEYKIDGKKYIVHSHFVGEKDVDIVIRNIAFARALTETLSGKTA